MRTAQAFSDTRVKEEAMEQDVRFEDLPDVLTISEACLYLRISKSSLYEAVKLKLIPAVRIQRRILIPKSGLRKVIEASLEG
jgi:excisionase family DNA binding protein